MFHVLSCSIKINKTLRLITNDFITLILIFSLLLSSCQSEQIQWIEGLNNDSIESNKPAHSTDFDKQMAYLHKYPKDTLQNYIILKKSIKEALEKENEDLIYKIILIGLKKYPKLIFEKEFYTATYFFYHYILKEEETTNWLSGIILENWNEDQKTAFFMKLYHSVKEGFINSNSYKGGEQILNMAKIHSLVFPDSDQSALFLWKSYEILHWMDSNIEALNLLDLILVRHKSWVDIKKVKKEREKLIRSKNRLKWMSKDKIYIDTFKKYQAPVS